MKTYSAKLVTVAPVTSAFPEPELAEIAVVGRSNSGKSTLINTVVGVKRLARVSAQPGRTRAIIFFEIDERFLLVDLPGYGFAAGPKKEQASWRKLVAAYFESQRPIVGVIALFDIRRKPDDLDLALISIFDKNNICWQPVWTKADKIKKRDVIKQSKELDRLYGIDGQGIAFSSKSRMGREALLEWMERRSRSEPAEFT